MGYVLNYVITFILAVLYAIMSLVIRKPELAFHIDDIALKHPDEPEIVSNTYATLLNTVPCVFILVTSQAAVRNFHDFHHASFGFVFAIILQAFVKSFLWVNFGDLRPDLLSKCRIQEEKLVPGQVYYYPSKICQPGLEINTPGWPSGHASQSAVCWMFVALYLNGKLKPLASNTSHVWKFVLCWIVTLMVPVFISLSRVRDFSHYAYQVAWGFALGIVTALVSYRLMYCSLFGPDNHVPTYYDWISKRRLLLQQQHNRENEPETGYQHVSSPALP